MSIDMDMVKIKDPQDPKTEGRKPRVLVAMSGGVDSSVAAGLLVEAGYEVVGATMQVWDYSQCDINEGSGTCCSSLDVDDARAVADKLQIPFYVLNCETQFKEKVIDPFISSYLKGETPLPCVNCNTFLKFDHLVRKMNELECDFLATGHYAQIKNNESGIPQVFTSEDSWKDQTYFLFTIDPQIIPKLLFPVGGMNKKEVRAWAEAKGLVTARKKDSTGICFVGTGGYQKFIEENVSSEKLSEKAGNFRRYPSGEILGQHAGIHRFTIGQSKGFGLDHHEKLFVVRIDPIESCVWLGDEEFIYQDELQVYDVHYLDQVQDGETLNVKIRYQHAGSAATITQKSTQDKSLSPQSNQVPIQGLKQNIDRNINQPYLNLKFKDKQRAVTAGQAAVFYRGQQLVGGGWIR